VTGDGEYYFDLYDWRNAVASPAGPSNSSTRHVLLTLSLHMNPQGAAWPSQTTLARRSGLSLRTVKTALDDAEAAAWIVRSWHGFSGQGWRRTRYQGTIPADVDLATKPWELDSRWKRGAAVAPPSTPQRGDVVQTARDVVQITTEGGATIAPKVVQQLHTNSSSELLKNNSSSEGLALTRATGRVTHANEQRPEPGTQPNPTAARRNGSGLRSSASEVLQGARKPEPKPAQLTAAAGHKFVDALLSMGDDVGKAIEAAQRQGYPVTAESLRDHLTQRGAA
jgi:hypothetical protein